MPTKKQEAAQRKQHDARVRRYHDSNKGKGLSQTKIWVPTHRVAELKAIAQKMRDEHAASQKS